MPDSTHPTTTGGVMCEEPRPATPPHHGLFPPRDADAETYRTWLVSSPWPEVVFASARTP